MNDPKLYLYLLFGSFVAMTVLFVMTEMEARKLRKQAMQLKPKKKTKK